MVEQIKSLNDISENIKQSNTHEIGILQGEDSKKGTESI